MASNPREQCNPVIYLNVYFSLCTEGQTTLPSEQINGSSTEIFYSWRVGKDIVCFPASKVFKHSCGHSLC